MKFNPATGVALVGMLFSWSAFGETGNFLMGSMGDSITAGTFADSHALASHEEATLAIHSIPQNAWIPFLGHTTNKVTLSWSSGNRIQSHYNRLKSYLGSTGNLDVINVAIPGEKAVGMLGEAQVLAAAMSTGMYDSLKYVTFLIGANDACASDTPEGTDNTVFAEQLMAAFQTLASIQQNEPIRILVSSVPRIPDVGQPEFMKMRTADGLSTCRFVQTKLLKECNNMTVWSTPAQYTARVAVVEGKNQVIQNVVRTVKTHFPQLDVVYSSSMWNEQIVPGFMAADCFHPNETGHEEIAEKLWNDQPWFK